MNSFVLSQSSLIPLLLITSFLSISLPSSVYAAGEYANCSQPITCGSLKSNISYPFWGANRAQYCGKSGYQVSCQSTVPMFTMMNMEYRILNMNNSTTTATPTVTVAREDYWGKLCPSSYSNTTLNLFLFAYAPGPQNVSFFYGCSISTATEMTMAALGVSFAGITRNCSSTSTVSFLTEKQTAKLPDASTWDSCQAVVLVPVSAAAADLLDKNQSSTIDAAVDGGFELNFQNVDTGLCNECVTSGGACGEDTSAKFICYCQNGTSTTTCDSISSSTNPSSSSDSRSYIKIIKIIGISVGATVAILIVLRITKMSRKKFKKMIFTRKELRNQLDIATFIRNYGSIAPKQYSYADLVKMTNSFEDQIGRGGFGTVYKGKLQDGLLVAVKLLTESKGDGEEFINEVASIGRTSHVNVVTLLGFCYQRNKRALIYEYMPNGSLDKFIHNQGSTTANCHLEWRTLSEVAVGVARGLEYLHRGCNTRILHLDIKPQNILLDEDFCPKISDFGLAKLCKTKESIVSMVGARGTAGYVAPEVYSRSFGGVSHKSDVYSYGMLVLDMVGARRNLHSEVAHTSEEFPHYVYKDLELGNDESVFRAIPEEEHEIVRKMILISLRCIQTLPSDRPSMSKVVEMLEGPLHSLTVPPKPLLFCPIESAINEQSSSNAEVSLIVSQESETCF